MLTAVEPVGRELLGYLFLSIKEDNVQEEYQIIVLSVKI